MDSNNDACKIRLSIMDVVAAKDAACLLFGRIHNRLPPESSGLSIVL